MKVKKIEALERYFKTENEHWNGYAFEMLCEVLQKVNFANPETPLQLFSKAVDIFGFQGIPYNVLINPDGIVIGESLRGSDLMNKLQEELKK